MIFWLNFDYFKLFLKIFDFFYILFDNHREKIDIFVNETEVLTMDTDS